MNASLHHLNVTYVTGNGMYEYDRLDLLDTLCVRTLLLACDKIVGILKTSNVNRAASSRRKKVRLRALRDVHMRIHRLFVGGGTGYPRSMIHCKPMNFLTSGVK
jgi:hypothetical protein